MSLGTQLGVKRDVECYMHLSDKENYGFYSYYNHFEILVVTFSYPVSMGVQLGLKRYRESHCSSQHLRKP
jgi:hypothetical protein